MTGELTTAIDLAIVCVVLPANNRPTGWRVPTETITDPESRLG